MLNLLKVAVGVIVAYIIMLLTASLIFIWCMNGQIDSMIVVYIISFVSAVIGFYAVHFINL